MTKSKIHIYIMWLAAFLMAACTDKVFEEENQELVSLTIEAQPEATRTALEGTSVVWSEGDEVAVYDFRSSKHRFTSVTTEGRTKFVGKVTAKSEPFAAIYPYDLGGETASSAVALSANLPAEQYVVADGFPTGMNISVAKGARNIDGSPSSVTFHNVCQLLRFTVPAYAADKVTSIVFTAQTAVAGKLNINYSAETPVVSITQTESKTITVLPPRRTSTFAAGTYHILTAPVQLNGFSMTMQTSDGKTYRLASSAQFGGVAGRIYSLGSIDLVNTPKIEISHVYEDGLLQGTKVSVSDAPIEGQTWTVTIKDADGTTVRTLSGTGNLTSDETDASWPYLPAGNYTVEYKYTTSNNREITKTLPTLKVPDPSLTLSVDCYTAHTKYEEGNISAANACDRLTIYNPSAKLSVASKLMTNTNYTRTFKRTLNYNNQNKTTTETTNSPSWEDYTGVAVSGSLYTFSVTANFAGTQVEEAIKQVRITGLPYSINFKKHPEWNEDKGKIKWYDNSVRFGYESDLIFQGKEASMSNNSSVNIPANTGFCADYSLVIQTATYGTTFTVTAGSKTLFSVTEDGKIGDVTGTPHSHNNKTSSVVRDENNSITNIKCNNSYGLSLTYTELYGLTLKYGN